MDFENNEFLKDSVLVLFLKLLIKNLMLFVYEILIILSIIWWKMWNR